MLDRKYDVLIVDDKVENLQLLVDFLSQLEFRVRPVTSGNMAFSAIKGAKPDIVLLDIDMPGMDGYQVCSKIKENPELRDVPVIFLSALDEAYNKLRAFEVGGLDYITKPFAFDEVLARIRAHLALSQRQKEIKSQYDQDRARFDRLVQLRNDQIATVTHDIKNEVMKIYAGLDLIRVEGNLTDSQENYVNFSREAADRMILGMVNLLNHLQQEGEVFIVKKDVNLNEFLMSVQKEFLITAEYEKIEFIFEPASENIMIRIDPNAMGQALNNLLSNAFKYSDAGDRVIFSADVDESVLTLTVSDTGIGIPEEHLEKIFEKGFRVPTDRHLSVEGTGLGLGIVKRIVEYHQGTIHIASEFGKGTQFYIQLPVQ